MSKLQLLKITLLICILAEEIKRAKKENIESRVSYIESRFQAYDDAIHSIENLANTASNKG